MAQTPEQPASYPPGFAEQAEAFLQTQAGDGVRRLVCYDRDGAESLVITLPVTDRMQAAASYRQAFELWRNGGSVIRMRAEPGGGLPQNENRQPLVELPDFGLAP